VTDHVAEAVEALQGERAALLERVGLIDAVLSGLEGLQAVPAPGSGGRGSGPAPTPARAATGGLVACPECGEDVKPAGLGIHRAKAHGVNGVSRTPDGARERARRARLERPGGPLQCTLCPKTFSRQNGLSRHMSQTHGQQPAVRDGARPKPVSFDSEPIGRHPFDPDKVREATVEGGF